MHAGQWSWLGLVVLLSLTSAQAAWPHLPATVYLEFARDGNRSRYEASYFTRRNLLAALALAGQTRPGPGARSQS